MSPHQLAARTLAVTAGEDIVATRKLKHNGHQVVINDSGKSPKVTVGGEPLAVEKLGEQAYVTGALPHAKFSSLEDLVKAVISHAPLYNGRRHAKGA
jgi:hypothetical protein